MDRDYYDDDYSDSDSYEESEYDDFYEEEEEYFESDYYDSDVEDEEYEEHCLRSNQRNPNNDEYWRARGWPQRPDDWRERLQSGNVKYKKQNVAPRSVVTQNVAQTSGNDSHKKQNVAPRRSVVTENVAQTAGNSSHHRSTFVLNADNLRHIIRQAIDDCFPQMKKDAKEPIAEKKIETSAAA